MIAFNYSARVRPIGFFFIVVLKPIWFHMNNLRAHKSMQLRPIAKNNSRTLPPFIYRNGGEKHWFYWRDELTDHTKWMQLIDVIVFLLIFFNRFSSTFICIECSDRKKKMRKTVDQYIVHCSIKVFVDVVAVENPSWNFTITIVICYLVDSIHVLFHEN